MSPQQFREIAWNGLWKQNTGLAQLLGLCPILAISTSMVNAVSLGLATILARRGAIVTELSGQELREMFQIRSALFETVARPLRGFVGLLLFAALLHAPLLTAHALGAGAAAGQRVDGRRLQHRVAIAGQVVPAQLVAHDVEHVADGHARSLRAFRAPG